jgi:hypothetical protein
MAELAEWEKHILAVAARRMAEDTARVEKLEAQRAELARSDRERDRARAEAARPRREELAWVAATSTLTTRPMSPEEEALGPEEALRRRIKALT